MAGIARVDALVGAALITTDGLARLTAAEAILTKVLSLAPNHALAHMTLGTVQTFTKRAAQGIAECERALLLDHNLAPAHGLLGMAKCLLGRGEETEAHVNEAFRLSPRDIRAYQWMFFVAAAKFQREAYAEAVAWLRRSNEANRNYPIAHFHLAAALAQVGELGEARAAMKAGLALHPEFTISSFRANPPSENPTYLAGRERLYEGMRMAGVPEG